jgi:hypothetical protein
LPRRRLLKAEARRLPPNKSPAIAGGAFSCLR